MRLHYIEKWSGIQLYADTDFTQFVGTISPCDLDGYKWIVCREWAGRPDDVPALSRHRTLDAAKYRALSDWIDHCAAMQLEEEMSAAIQSMQPID